LQHQQQGSADEDTDDRAFAAAQAASPSTAAAMPYNS